jgi:hypothetical protein
MRRIPIQIDDKTYEWLRKRSFEEKRSIASIVRECLDEKSTARPKWTIKDFTFVGSGSSDDGDLAPVSENHDEAYAEAILSRWRKK